MTHRSRALRSFRALAILASATAAAGIIGLALGPTPAGWSRLLDWVLGEADPGVRSIFLDVRLPRVLLACFVGAALAGAGTAFQAVLRNPLADPYLLGVSGGAALGASVYVALAGFEGSAFFLARPAAAFGGSLVTLFLLFGLARARGRTGSLALLLVGVILNAFFSAWILFLLSVGDPARFQGVLFFLVGSVGSPPWSVVAGVGAWTAAGLAALMFLSHRLNLLALGEEAAGHLGVPVEATTWAAVVAASLVTAGAVAFTGLIGFVGLMVPHALRTALGPDHRLLLPASALGGAALLVLSDAIARTIAAPVEMPVGVVTALLGGPAFLFLFLKRVREGRP